MNEDLVKIDWMAGDKLLFNAPRGAVVLGHFGDASPIVAVAGKCRSAEDSDLTTFHIDVEGVPMPIVVMAAEDELKRFELVANSTLEYFAVESRGACFNFYKQLCEFQGWIFDASAALHVSYFLNTQFPAGVSDESAAEAAEFVNKLREQFFAYVNAVRLDRGRA